MKRDWRDFTNSKDKEIEILKLKHLDAQKALDKVGRPGSSNDVPVNVVSATGTDEGYIQTIEEENYPKPPNRPGGHGGGGGDGGYPGDPSDPGRAR